MATHLWTKQYARHVRQSISYPQIPVWHFLTETAAQYPDYVAMTFNDAHTTYGELNERVNRFVHVLRELGVGKGDRVALVLVN